MAKNKPKLLTPTGIAFLALSSVYIVAEAVFNIRLLEVAGSVKSDPSAIDSLQYFGRAISGYGFSLLMLGLFAGSGFKLDTRWRWIAFWLLATVCVMPLLVTADVTGIGPHHSVPEGAHLDLADFPLLVMPLLGTALVLMSAGKFRFHVIIGVCLMAWPAMFLGQKLVIERYLIDHTTWEERQNARYMLMLRAGLEDCSLDLGGIQFCDARLGAADMKAARIIVSTLWMLSPAHVIDELKDSRNRLVENAASTGQWFSGREQYKKYVAKVQDTRSKYVSGILTKYYVPYKRASDMYAKALDPATITRQAAEAAEEVEAGIEDGWRRYKSAVREYNQTLGAYAKLGAQAIAPYGEDLNENCADGICEDAANEVADRLDIDRAMRNADDMAEREFQARTGYRSDIPDRKTFMAEKKTRDAIRDKVQSAVRQRMDAPAFSLPDDWVYDAPTFREKIEVMIRDKVKATWKQRFGETIPPGLDKDAFLATLGIDQLPSASQMTMSEEDFFKRHVVPGHQKMVDSMLGDLEKEKEKYAPDASDMAEGKEYVEALYIPTISLVISLSIVILTLTRGLMALMRAVLKSGKKPVDLRWLAAGQGAVAALFLGLLVVLPHIFPNPYAVGDAYDKVVAYAKARHPWITPVLNWTVHVQPVVYRVAKDVGRVAG